MRDVEVEVECGAKEGKLLGTIVTCFCEACCEEREETGGGGTFTLTGFEAHAGKGSHKNSKKSIRVKGAGQSLGAWLAAQEQRGGGHDLRHPPKPGHSASHGGGSGQHGGGSGGSGGLEELAEAARQRQLLSPTAAEGGQEQGGSTAPSDRQVAAALAAVGGVAGGELGPGYASGSLGSTEEEDELEDEDDVGEGDDEATVMGGKAAGGGGAPRLGSLMHGKSVLQRRRQQAQRRQQRESASPELAATEQAEEAGGEAQLSDHATPRRGAAGKRAAPAAPAEEPTGRRVQPRRAAAPEAGFGLAETHIIPSPLSERALKKQRAERERQAEQKHQQAGGARGTRTAPPAPRTAPQAASPTLLQRRQRRVVEVTGEGSAERQQQQQGQGQPLPAGKRPRGRPRKHAVQAEEEEQRAQAMQEEEEEEEQQQQQRQVQQPAAKRPRGRPPKQAQQRAGEQQAVPPPLPAPPRCSLTSFQQLEDGDGVPRGAQLSLRVSREVCGSGGRGAPGAVAGDASVLLFERLAVAAGGQGLNLMSFNVGAPSDQGLPVDLEVWLPPEAHATLMPHDILAFVRSL